MFLLRLHAKSDVFRGTVGGFCKKPPQLLPQLYIIICIRPNKGHVIQYDIYANLEGRGLEMNFVEIYLQSSILQHTGKPTEREI